jgi:hypothetical protein
VEIAKGNELIQVSQEALVERYNLNEIEEEQGNVISELLAASKSGSVGSKVTASAVGDLALT